MGGAEPSLLYTSALFGALLTIGAALGMLYWFSRHKPFVSLGVIVFLLLVSQGALFGAAAGVLQLSDEALLWWWSATLGGALFLSTFFSRSLLKAQKMRSELNWGVTLLAWLVWPAVVAAGLMGYSALLFYVCCLALAMSALGVYLGSRFAKSMGWHHAGWLLALTGSVYVLVFEPLALRRLVSTFAEVNVAVTAVWFVAVVKQFAKERSDMLLEQQQALAAARAQESMQQQLLDIEEQAREELENKVQERTFELEVTLRELQDANRELEEKNTQDALTGLKNRRFFDKKYLAEFRRSRRELTQLSLVLLDIDHFKKVNDNHGHLAGDDVIRFVGRSITDMLKRPSDAGCRYGGEEFALILPNTDVQGAIAVAEALRQRIEQASIETQAGMLKVTVSCGVYTAVAEMDMNQNQYVEQADKALYCAKQSGRNRVVHQMHMSAQTNT